MGSVPKHLLMRRQLLVETDSPNVHRLILLHGREQARQMVDVKTRPLVEIAAEVMADESRARHQLHRLLPDQPPSQTAARRPDLGEEGIPRHALG